MVTKRKLLAFLVDGGLGIYLPYALYVIFLNQTAQTFDYQFFTWRHLFVVTVIALACGSLSIFLPRISVGNLIFGTTPNKKNHKLFWHHPIFWIITLYFVISIIAGVYITQISFADFFSESGLASASRIFFELTSPNWKIFPEAFLAIIETIYMAFMSTIVAIPLALGCSLLASKKIMHRTAVGKIIYYILHPLLNIIRSIEPLIWAIIFTVWVGIGPFAGMLALIPHSVVALMKFYSQEIDQIDDRSIEAIEAVGANFFQVICYGIVPKIIIPFITHSIYRWDTNVRMATVIGLVGGGGAGTLLMQYQGLARWHEVGLLIFCVAIIVWVIDIISAEIREVIK